LSAEDFVKNVHLEATAVFVGGRYNLEDLEVVHVE